VVLKRRIVLLKTGIWILGFVPLGWALYRFFYGDGFGVNPIAELQLWGGLSTITALLVTLSITPLRRLTGWNDLQKARRLVGLFAFFYVTLHFLIWIGLDQTFDWEYIVEDITKRPYILIGFTGFLLLIPLALTSTKGWIRRLGKRWVTLHALVYVATVLGVIHFFFVTKADDRWPMLCLGIWAVLMVLRLAWRIRAQGDRGGRARARVAGDAAASVAPLVVVVLLGAGGLP
jgi:methionine sulfoxide reductase heme-binding subunit